MPQGRSRVIDCPIGQAGGRQVKRKKEKTTLAVTATVSDNTKL